MSRTKTIASTIVRTIQWMLIGLLVAAYLVGSVIAGMDGIDRSQNRTAETQVEPTRRVADSTARSLVTRRD